MAFIEKEALAVLGASAIALSPKTREVARKGAVYGLAGALTAGDVVSSAALGAARGAREGARGHSPAAQDGRSQVAHASTRRRSTAKTTES